MFFWSLTMQFSTAFLSSYSKKQLQNWYPVKRNGAESEQNEKTPKE